MADKPTITFAIPCRDGATHLPALVRSLLAQTYPQCRLLLVDDASTDASVALARKLAGTRLEVVQNATPLGIPGNWNRCLELSCTDYLCLAHQDDVYAPEFAAVMLAALGAAPEAGAVHCRAHTIDADGAPVLSPRERYKEGFWRRLPALETPAKGFQRLFAGNYVMCPTVVYRADAIAAAGAFDTHYRFVADWEWLLRLQAKGWQLAAVSQPLVSYRRHAEQATHREAESLRRYREEHAVLTHAREFGVSDGLLPEHARSTAMRDNLLFDAFGDLQARRPDAARDKLRLLGTLDPEARRSAPARALAAAMRLGWPGRRALATALNRYVAWSAR